MLSLTTSSVALVAPSSYSSPPTPAGIGRWLLDAALSSPLYKAVLVPQAKATMVKTAEQNGVAWTDALAWPVHYRLIGHKQC